MNKLLNRFKSFKWNHWLLIVLVLIFEAVCLYFLIGMSISISKGLTLFGGGYFQEDSTKVGSFDYVMLTIVCLLNLMMIFLFIYFVFFSKVEYVKKQTKTILNGKVVDINQNVENFDTKKEKDDKKDSNS